MTPYCAVEHLALSTFGAGAEQRIMGMLSGHQFTCHWDESGTDPGTETKSKADMPIILVGGYFAHVDEWIDFSTEWRKILLRNSLSSFHIVKFVNRRYPYRLWSEEKLELLIGDILTAIDNYARVYVAFAIEVDAYMEIVKARNLLETDIVRAYHICARKCIDTVSAWADAANYRPKILHIFDAGNSAWSSFEASFPQKMLDALNILQPISQSKIDVLPLQAACVFAHQVARNLLISDGLIPEGRRLYTPTLFRKPGLCKWIGIKELKELYREQLYIERVLKAGLPFRRVAHRDKLAQYQIEIMNELFKNPGEYSLNREIKEARKRDRLKT